MPMNLLTVKEASRVLGISPATLHRHCRARKIRYATLNGRSRLFRPEWLEEFVESQVVPPLESRQSTSRLSYQSTEIGSGQQESPEDWVALRLELERDLVAGVKKQYQHVLRKGNRYGT